MKAPPMNKQGNAISNSHSSVTHSHLPRLHSPLHSIPPNLPARRTAPSGLPLRPASTTLPKAPRASRISRIPASPDPTSPAPPARPRHTASARSSFSAVVRQGCRHRSSTMARWGTGESVLYFGARGRVVRFGGLGDLHGILPGESRVSSDSNAVLPLIPPRR